MKRIIYILLAILLLCLSACSKTALPENSFDSADSVSDVETYAGPLPQVSVISPVGSVDTVHPDVRAYLNEANRSYQDGDTSYSVQNDPELCDKTLPVDFSFRVENEDLFRDFTLEIYETENTSSFVSVSLDRKRSHDGTYNAALYNLKTGCEYTWVVSAATDEGVSVRSDPQTFRTEEGPRLLKIEGVRNFRDVGGWQTLSGSFVREGLLFRGANPDSATAAGQSVIRKDLGIKTELDLRNSDTEDLRSPFQKKLRYVNISAPSYSTFFEKIERDAAIMRLLANPDNYPVFYHCAGGADRTGVLSFALKALLGVKEIDLICDYELTPHRYRSGYQTETHDFNFPAFYQAFTALPGNTLQEKATFFYGEICGLSEMEIANITAILTTDGAVFTKPSPSQVKAVGGKVTIPVTLRSSGGVETVSDLNGSPVLFQWDGENLILMVNASGSGTIRFNDGHTLPVSWIAE